MCHRGNRWQWHLTKVVSVLLILFAVTLGALPALAASQWTALGSANQASDIGIGSDGAIYIIGYAANQADYNIYQWNGVTFEQITGNALRIAVATANSIALCNSSGQAYHYTPSSGSQPLGNSQCQDIAISNNGTNDEIYIVGAGDGDQPIAKWNGTAFEPISQGGNQLSGTRIAAASISPRGTTAYVAYCNQAGQVNLLTTITTAQSSSTLKQIQNTQNPTNTPECSDIGVGTDGTISITGKTDQKVYRWSGENFEPLGVTATQIAVGDAINVAIVDSSHAAFKGGGFYQPFHEPQVRYSRHGVLDTSLTVGFSEIHLNVPPSVANNPQSPVPTDFLTRAYDHMVPGPTLRVYPGETLNLLLRNNLDLSGDEQALTNQLLALTTQGAIPPIKIRVQDLTTEQKAALKAEDPNFNENNFVYVKTPSRPGCNPPTDTTGCDKDLDFVSPSDLNKLSAAVKTSLDAVLNRTNLHTHGWHVSPKSVTSPDGDVLVAHDNVLVQILPPNDPLAAQMFGADKNKVGISKAHTVNQQLQYSYDVPSYHAPGTHWYHAHKDGAVAIQVQNGMAGALIIDEPQGQEIIKGAEERVLVIQEINNVLQEQPGGSTTASRKPKQAGGGAGSRLPLLTTVNGLYQPTMHMRPGEIQRWRIVNAGSNTTAFNKLSVLDPQGNRVPFYVVAYDGVTLSNAQWANQQITSGYKSLQAPAAPPAPGGVDTPQNEVFIAAGNRVDILFQAPLPPDNQDGEPAYDKTLTYDIVVNADGLYFGTPGYPTASKPTAQDNPKLPLFNDDHTTVYGANESPAFKKNESAAIVTRPVFITNIIFPNAPGDSPTDHWFNKVPRSQTRNVIGHVEVASLPGPTQQIPANLPEPQAAYL